MVLMTKSRAGGGGRKPLPTALKALRSNPGRRPLNEDEPKPDVRLPNRRLRPAGSGAAQVRSSWR